MTNHQPGPPGTVSKVLWHFTGGPNWDSSKKRQEPNPKRLSEAFNALCGILKTKQVRVGRYREVVIIHTTRHNFDRPTKVWSTSPATVELESVPVCCLSDIPIAHLSYHASRYGK